MPSFAEALTSKQMDLVIDYMRGFCTEKGWPRGELNLPRALMTEKSFPENEVVITNSTNLTGSPGISNDIVFEQTLGARNQLEITVPVNFTRPDRGLWYGGFGDVGIGFKRILLSKLAPGSILAVQGEVIAPTGNRAHGLGSGVTTFETFAAYDQLLPGKMFLQFQGGADLPTDTKKAPQSIFLRSALGKSFNESNGLGRLWSPMVEFVGTRDLMSGARNDWDVIPEFQVTLSKRQHVRANVGVSIPVTDTAGRSAQLMVYVLWDRADGKLYEGWK
jgi:hypothetical protein